MIWDLLHLLPLLASQAVASPTQHYNNTTVPLTLCNVTETGSKKQSVENTVSRDYNPFADCAALYVRYSNDNGYLNVTVADVADAGWVYIVEANKTCGFGLEVEMDEYPGSVQVGNQDIALIFNDILHSQSGTNPVFQISGQMECGQVVGNAQAVNWTVFVAPDASSTV